MRLNLTKPLVVFDLETTGLDLVNDRIIQISYVKVRPTDKDGEEDRKSIFVNNSPNSSPTRSQAATSPDSTATASMYRCSPRSFSVRVSTSTSRNAA